MNKNVAKLIQEQFIREYESGYKYQALAVEFAELGLDGMTAWFREQAKEEFFHAMKMENYLLTRGVKPIYTDFKIEEEKIDSVIEGFEKGLAHEKDVTAYCNNIFKVAREEGDFASESFMKWFVVEQVEEEETFGDIINKLNLIGEDKNALLAFDKELGARVFVEPAAE